MRILIWAIATLFGVVVGVRWLVGPFQVAGLAVNVPLNPEGIFGVLVTVLSGFRVSDTICTPGKRRGYVIPLVALAGFALYPALSVGFLSDDFILVQQARSFTWATLGPLFTTAGGDGFFRPLGYVSFDLNAAADPWVWHFVSLLIHTVNAVLVGLLAQRLGASQWVAFLAAGLFALHGTHLEAAVWIAGRFDLLATMFTLGALLAFGRNTGIALMLTLAALWSKEAAFVLPALTTLLAWYEKRALRKSVPFWAVAAAAFLYRWMLLGGIGGYAAESGGSAFFSLKFATTAKALFVRLWTSLYFPLNWSLEPDIITAVLACAYVAVLLWLAWNAKAGPAFRVAATGLMISVLPPLHLLGGAADLSGGRLLYLPSVWFCLLLAFAASNLERRATAVVIAVLLAFHFAALRHNLPFWQRTSDQVRAFCETPDAANPPRSIDGVPALANGLSECTQR